MVLGGGRWLCSVHASEARWDVPGGPAGPSCRGQLCRESSSSAGRGFARRPSGVPSTPVPALGQHWGSVRAARQPDHGLGGSRDCQEQEAFPRGRQIHAPGRGQPAPRRDVGMGPACGGAPGAQHPHRPGRLSLAHDLSQTDPRVECGEEIPTPRLVFKVFGGFCRVTSSADRGSPLTCWCVLANWCLPLQGPALVATSPPCVLCL